jgi:hypothetical protein
MERGRKEMGTGQVVGKGKEEICTFVLLVQTESLSILDQDSLSPNKLRMLWPQKYPLKIK